MKTKVFNPKELEEMELTEEEIFEFSYNKPKSLQGKVKIITSQAAINFDREFKEEFSQLIELAKKEGIEYIIKIEKLEGPAEIEFFKTGYSPGFECVMPKPKIYFYSKYKYMFNVKSEINQCDKEDDNGNIINKAKDQFFVDLYEYFLEAN